MTCDPNAFLLWITNVRTALTRLQNELVDFDRETGEIIGDCDKLQEHIKASKTVAAAAGRSYSILKWVGVVVCCLAAAVLIGTGVGAGFGVGLYHVVFAGLTNCGIAAVGASIGGAAGAGMLVAGAYTASSAYN